MKEQKLTEIKKQIRQHTRNRSHNRFNKALWFGSKHKLVPKAGYRKVKMNTPGKLARDAPGFIVGQAAGAAIGIGVTALTAPIVGPAAVAVGIGVTIGVDILLYPLSQALDKAVEMGATEIKDFHSKRKDARNKGEEMLDQDRMHQDVKRSVKDLKNNAVHVIDRNLVKLKDSLNKVNPTIKAMEQANYQTKSAMTQEWVEEQKAHASLTAISEAQYYANKVHSLATVTRNALDDILKNLDGIRNELETVDNKVSKFILTHLDA